MKMKKSNKFTPYNSIATFYFILIYFGINIFNLGAFFDGMTFVESIPKKIALVLNIIFIILIILHYVFYPVKYVVDDTYLIKYRRKNIVFKIKISDLQKVYIWKPSFTKTLSLVLDIFTVAYNITPNFTIISFLFSDCEIDQNDKETEASKCSLKQKEDGYLCEKNESFSIRRCRKLCKALKIVPEYVKPTWRGIIK